jgi:hypothetical protein
MARADQQHRWEATSAGSTAASERPKNSGSRYFVPQIRSCRAVSPMLRAFTTLPLR